MKLFTIYPKEIITDFNEWMKYISSNKDSNLNIIRK